MILKNKFISVSTLALITLAYGCATAPKQKVAPIPYAIYVAPEHFVGKKGHAVNRKVAEIPGQATDALVELFDELKGVNPELAAQLLRNARTQLTDLADDTATVEKVAAEIKDPVKKAEFLAEFSKANKLASLEGDAFASVRASAAKIEAAHFAQVAAAGNTEQAATGIVSHVGTGSKTGGTRVGTFRSVKSGALISEETTQSVLKTKATLMVAGKETTPAYEAGEKTWNVFLKVGDQVGNDQMCVDMGEQAMKKVIENKEGQLKLASEMEEQFPTDLEARKECFQTQEGLRILKFARDRLLSDNPFQDAIALIEDCGQGSKASVKTIRKLQKSGSIPESVACN